MYVSSPTPPFFFISVYIDPFLGNWNLHEAKEGERMGFETKGKDTNKIAF